MGSIAKHTFYSVDLLFKIHHFFPFSFLSFCVITATSRSTGEQICEINTADTSKLEQCINKKLSEQALRGQRNNLTTNRCEAAHLTIIIARPSKMPKSNPEFSWASYVRGTFNEFSCNEFSGVGEQISRNTKHKTLYSLHRPPGN